MPTCLEWIVYRYCFSLSPDPGYCCSITTLPIVDTPREHSGERGMIWGTVGLSRMQPAVCHQRRPTQA